MSSGFFTQCPDPAFILVKPSFHYAMEWILTGHSDDPAVLVQASLFIDNM